MTWVVTILAFAGIIAFHEWGHFLFARLAGMRVDRFSIGFGPTIVAKRWGETEWALCAIPLGGYVKIAGMDPTEEEYSTDPRAYNNKPVWRRLLVIGAGPAFNYILSAVLITVALVLGGLVLNVETATIGGVDPDLPAAAAGLERGDRIVEVEGVAISDWASLQAQIHPRPDEALSIKVQRGSELLELQITPKGTQFSGKTVGIIGIVPATRTGEPVPIGEAIVGGVSRTWDWNVRILVSLGGILVSLPEILFGDAPSGVGGPVEIFKQTNRAATEGIVPLLMLVAFISVNLGLFNLLPIPALDGGRLVFLAAEAIRRRPINARIEMTVHAVGFLFLLGLIVLITIGDLTG